VKTHRFKLLRYLILAVVTHGKASPNEDWKTYRRAVQNVTIELAVPYGLVSKWGKAEWTVPYSAPRLEDMYSGRASQVALFNATIDIPGPIWVGRYAFIDFHGIVSKKPDWFKGDLFDVDALKGMTERKVKSAVKNDYEFHFEVVTINGQPWVYWWFDIWEVETPGAKTAFRHFERYTRPLTDDLYLDVAIDLSKASSAENKNMGWLPEAEKLREKLKNALVIRYPGDALKAGKFAPPMGAKEP
jgi:hypothetical protein